MEFRDRAPLEKVRRLADGRISAVAKFARSGCYTYTGSEVGRPHLASVAVYRPEDEVFSEDAMASFAHKAITLDHPSEPVSAKNWRKVSVGYTEGRVARDGAYVEIPLILADGDAVSAFDSGQARQLSAGYSCDLIWGDGVAPDGTAYQATQRTVRGNHIALVPAGRAGEACRIGDSRSSVDAADRSRALAAGRYAETSRMQARGEYIERLTGRRPTEHQEMSVEHAQGLRDEAREKYIRDQLRVSRYEG